MRIAILLLLTVCLSALGAGSEKITASLVVTNGTTVGQVLTVNGSTRLWTNIVTQPASQILTNSTPEGSKTNAYNAIGAAPFSQVTIIDKGATNFDLVGASGLSMNVICTNWATVTYSTQTVSSMTTVRVPVSSETAGVQTNVASGLVAGINLSAQTNQISQASTAAAQLVGLTNDQSIAGIKIFGGTLSGILGKMTNGTFLNPTLTNAINYGNAFRSPGSSTGSEQFGYAAGANGDFSVAFGAQALADGTNSVALGYQSEASQINSSAVGRSAFSGGTNGLAVGYAAQDNHDGSSAIGAGSATTTNHQIMLGTSAEYVNCPGDLRVEGRVRSFSAIGTNNFPAGSDVALGRYALSSLANGNNAAIPVGTNVFIEVSGPSAAFTINGINGSPNRDGKFVIILNQTGQDMTVAHESGTDPVPANRIVSMSGSDRTTTGNGTAMLIYSGSASRWILISFDP